MAIFQGPSRGGRVEDFSLWTAYGLVKTGVATICCGAADLCGETGFHSFPSSDRVSLSTVDFTI